MDALIDFFRYADMPAATENFILSLRDKIAGDADFSDAMRRVRDGDKFSSVMDTLAEIGKKYGESEYSVFLLLLALSSPIMKKKYEDAGYSEEMYRGACRDITYKSEECRKLLGKPGNRHPEWVQGFFDLHLFSLGRLQFELSEFKYDSYECAGAKISRGDKVINTHIPSSGPLLKEDCLDSYRRAHEFFNCRFNGMSAFVCSSWLLYEPYKEVFPKGGNTRSFTNTFDVIENIPGKKFDDIWRVFSVTDCKDPDKLPEDTVMRRNFKEYIKSGGSFGYGYGIFLFDGEKIINHHGD